MPLYTQKRQKRNKRKEKEEEKKNTKRQERKSRRPLQSRFVSTLGGTHQLGDGVNKRGDAAGFGKNLLPLIDQVLPGRKGPLRVVASVEAQPIFVESYLFVTVLATQSRS